MESERQSGLKRRIGPLLLTAYGVGIIVGAGIYVLVGAVAGAAGVWAPLAFVIAGAVAVPSALSYSELATRLPEAAGGPAYVEFGLGSHRLAMLVGWTNVLVNLLAAAAILRGGVGYLVSLVNVHSGVAIVLLGAVLTAIAVVGVLESLTIAAILTTIEVLGLLLAVGAGFFAEPIKAWSAPLAQFDATGLSVAVALAFFAFIGFESMVNVAEEVRAPHKVIPRAIVGSLAGAGLLYVLVSVATVRSVPSDVLALSDRPLALVWESGTGVSAMFLSAIAVAAALNGVLAQLVTGSRILYGLGKRSPRLAIFRPTSSRFGTPVLATVMCGAIAVTAAVALPVVTLAEFTGQVLLVVFAVVNAALIGAKRKAPDAPFRVHGAVPWFGLAACIAAFAASLVSLPT